MSSAMAIAAVSEVLRQLLDNELKGNFSFLTELLGSHDVTAQPPDLLSIGTEEKPWLNLFLYQVTPNAGWRNASLPSRGGSGERISNPPLALDLHYLLTASGKKRLEAETLLGCGMQVLHEIPFLARDYIRSVLPADSNDPVNKALAAAGLAEQAEPIRISPQAMSTDEMSKLWTIIGAKYRPSVAYLVSVVLIQSEKESRTPLPVLMIGKDDHGVHVQPGLIPPYPTIERIELPKRQISALPGDTLTVVGHHFTEDPNGPLTIRTMTVRLSHPRLPEPIDLPVAPDNYTNAHVTVSLPTGDDSCPAGVYTLSLLINHQGPQNIQTTNELPLSLAPSIRTVNGQALKSATAPPTAQRSNLHNDLGDLKLELTCEPPVLPEQRAALLLGARAVPAEPHVQKTASLNFTARDVCAGTFRLRLRVDGVDSLLIDRSDERHPRFDETQQVVIQ